MVRITGLKWTEQRQLGASTAEQKTLIIARGFDRGRSAPTLNQRRN